MVDNKKAFIEMTGHLFNLGHRAIASIGGPPIYNFTKQRAEGWLQAMADGCLFASAISRDIRTEF